MFPTRLGETRGKVKTGRQGRKRQRPVDVLVLLLPRLFPAALARQSFLRAPLFTRLEVERVAFHFLDDVLGLHFALEPAQRILQTFTFLNPNFCQSQTPPNRTELDLCKLSQGFEGKSSMI